MVLRYIVTLPTKFDWPKTLVSSSYKRLRKVTSYLSGWPGVARLGIIVCTFTLIVNVVTLLAARVMASNQQHPDQRLLTVFEGDCDTGQSIFTAAHLVINILSTALLAASGACIQALGAPSREEVDRAHEKGRSLRIGTFDLWNVLHIPKSRSLLVAILAASSLPLHLFYNATTFFSAFAINPHTYGVFANFLEGGLFKNENLLSPGSDEPSIHQATLADLQIRALYTQELFECNLTTWYSQSQTLFTDPPFADAILLVTDDTNDTDSVFAQELFASQGPGPFGVFPSWIYNSQPMPQPQQRIIVDRCLARPYDERCEVLLHETSMSIVVGCNLLKLVCILLCLHHREHIPLMTMGDAVSTFIKNEDEFFRSLVTPSSHRNLTKIKAREVRWRYWFCAPRFIAWVTTATLWFIAIFIPVSAKYSSGTFLELFPDPKGHGGLGDTSPKRQMAPYGDAPSGYLLDATVMIQSAFVANVLQIVLSGLYLVLNNALTVMIMSAEYSHFVVKRRGLRVSQPTGAQQPSLQLNIPIKYALANLTAWAVLHWLASQMVYLRLQRFFDWVDLIPEPKTHMGVYLSTSALWAFVALGSTIVCLTFVLGFRRYPDGIPLTFNNSMAIAAACHPGAGEPENAAELPLMYGKRRNEQGEWIYSFSARPVERVNTDDRPERNVPWRIDWLSRILGARATRALQRRIIRRREGSDGEALLLEEINTGKN